MTRIPAPNSATHRAPARTVRERQPDDRLVELARLGDERAFEVLIERHRPLLLAHCRELVGDAAAQDAVQQACISAWHALLRGCQVRHARAWLYTIAHRAALQGLREGGARAEAPCELQADRYSTEEEFEQSTHARAALAAVAALPSRERAALIGTSLQGHTGRDTARVLSVSEQTVRQLIFHGRIRARAAMSGYLLTPLAGLPAWMAERARRAAAQAQDAWTGIGCPQASEALAKVAPLLLVGAVLGVPVAVSGLTRHRPAHAVRSRSHSSEPAAPGRTREGVPARHSVRPSAAMQLPTDPSRYVRIGASAAAPAGRRGHEIASAVASEAPAAPAGEGGGAEVVSTVQMLAGRTTATEQVTRAVPSRGTNVVASATGQIGAFAESAPEVQQPVLAGALAPGRAGEAPSESLGSLAPLAGADASSGPRQLP